MFYLQYLKAELFRRLGKTVTITFGLAMASAIIIIIISVSQSLTKAQETVLNPLQNVGTDIMVTRSIDQENVGQLDNSTRQELMSENRFQTDLSKLGNPGDSFSTDSFVSGSLLTFEATESAKLSTNTVKNSAQGLILNAVHQEGTIPQIVAEFKTGGEKYSLEQDIAPMSDAEMEAQEESRNKVMNEMKTKGIDPRSEEGRAYMRKALGNAMPERFSRAVFEFTAPEKTYSQQLDTPETDIQTENYTIAGVDTTKTDIGLILPNQITEGNYFSEDNQVIVNVTFAQKKNLTVGSSMKIGGQDFTIVGLVEPKLYTNVADLYIPLSNLQTISGKENKINILLLKTNDTFSVEETATQIGNSFPGAKVTTASDTVKEVTGSLVNAANLMNKFTGIVSVIVIASAFAIVSLLTMLSMNKRGREIGVLKALGWKNSTVSRQILLENVCLGIFGAALGIGIGALGIYVLNRYNISLAATIANGTSLGQSLFRGGSGMIMKNSAQTASDVSANIDLKISYSWIIFILGSAIALIGSIIAGGLAAAKSMSLRPQEALRQLE